MAGTVRTALFEAILFPWAFEARSRSFNAASSASFSVTWPATAPHHCSNSLVSLVSFFLARFSCPLSYDGRRKSERPRSITSGPCA